MNFNHDHETVWPIRETVLVIQMDTPITRRSAHRITIAQEWAQMLYVHLLIVAPLATGNVA